MVLRSRDIKPTLSSDKLLHRTTRTNHERHFEESLVSIRRANGPTCAESNANRYHPTSPAELLYGRRVVSNSPVATWNASGYICEIRARLDQRHATAKECHDARGVTDLAEFSHGQHIRKRRRSPTDGILVLLPIHAYHYAPTKYNRPAEAYCGGTGVIP